MKPEIFVIIGLIALFSFVGYKIFKKDHKEAKKSRTKSGSGGSKVKPDEITDTEESPKETES